MKSLLSGDHVSIVTTAFLVRLDQGWAGLNDLSASVVVFFHTAVYKLNLLLISFRLPIKNGTFFNFPTDVLPTSAISLKKLCEVHYIFRENCDRNLLARPDLPSFIKQIYNNIIKGTYWIRNIVNNNSCLGSTVVHRCKTVVPLLTSCVPNLKLYCRVI